MFVRSISTQYHKNKQFPHEQSPRAQFMIFISHNPQQGQSTCSQLILNLLSMPVHNIISNKGMMMHLNQSNIHIIHIHLNYRNYTGVIQKTQLHKKFKSIIHHLIPICFDILKLQFTFNSNNFPYITPVLVPMPVTPLIRDPHLSPLPIVYFIFFYL